MSKVKNHVRFNPPMDKFNYEGNAQRIPLRWNYVTFVFPYGSVGWEHVALTPNAVMRRIDNGRTPTVEGRPPDQNWDVEVTYPRNELRLALTWMANNAGRDDIVERLNDLGEADDAPPPPSAAPPTSLRDWRKFLT